MMNNERKMLALLTLAEVFDARFTEARQVAYLEALADLSAEAVAFAVRQASRHETFFPVPAKLREYAGCYRPVVPAGPVRPAVALLPEQLAVNQANIAHILAMLKAKFYGDKPTTIPFVPKRTRAELERQRAVILAECGEAET